MGLQLRLQATAFAILICFLQIVGGTNAYGESRTESLFRRISKGLSSENGRIKMIAAYYLSALMVEHKTEHDFAVDFLLSVFRAELPVAIPEHWETLVRQDFRRRKPLPQKFYQTGGSYRFIKSARKIVGPSGTFAVPAKFKARKSPIFFTETDRFICFIGVGEFGLTRLLLFRKDDETLVGAVSLFESGGEDVGGQGPMPVGNQVSASLVLGSSSSELYVFSAVFGTLVVERVDLKRLESKIVFLNTDSLPK